MHHEKCVAFLRWAMPRLGLSWAGFAHRHRQVCKRLHSRTTELGLSGYAAYRDYLLDHDTEWGMVDACCRVTVSRFCRDKDVFNYLASEVLPDLADKARSQGRDALRAWSAGCGAGEEPFSLALAWRLDAASRFPGIRLDIVASEIDDTQLARARDGCYRPSSLRSVPPKWMKDAFTASGPLRCLKPEYREGIEFIRQDVRANAPKGPFDLILCRNLAFTYFDAAQQREILTVIQQELAPGGVFVIGRRESLPGDTSGISVVSPHLRVFRKAPGG